MQGENSGVGKDQLQLMKKTTGWVLNVSSISCSKYVPYMEIGGKRQLLKVNNTHVLMEVRSDHCKFHSLAGSVASSCILYKSPSAQLCHHIASSFLQTDSPNLLGKTNVKYSCMFQETMRRWFKKKINRSLIECGSYWSAGCWLLFYFTFREIVD